MRRTKLYLHAAHLQSQEIAAPKLIKNVQKKLSASRNNSSIIVDILLKQNIKLNDETSFGYFEKHTYSILINLVLK